MRYRIQPEVYAGRGEYAPVGPPIFANTVHEARQHVRTAIDLTGVVPRVTDAQGRQVWLLTDEELCR